MASGLVEVQRRPAAAAVVACVVDRSCWELYQPGLVARARAGNVGLIMRTQRACIGPSPQTQKMILLLEVITAGLAWAPVTAPPSASSGHVTVFHEDVIRHYQTHPATRRAARPAREYRAATVTEWSEFETHFDKRKVELGDCGRPYGTPCEHEHACIRCPMLHVDPAAIDRLDEINTDLIARRERAQTEGWLGEIEGIDLTLRFLHDKRADAQHLTRLEPTNLGMPTIRT
jgi:hypothetical protein